MKFIHLFTPEMINKLCKDGKEIRITMYVVKPGADELYHLNRHGNIDRVDNVDVCVEEYQYLVRSWDDLFQVDNEDMNQLDDDTKESLR